MRGFYTNALDAEAAEDVTLADVQDTFTRPSKTINVPLATDPFENTDAPADEVPF